jgi:hypothetical protein
MLVAGIFGSVRSVCVYPSPDSNNDDGVRSHRLPLHALEVAGQCELPIFVRPPFSLEI